MSNQKKHKKATPKKAAQQKKAAPALKQNTSQPNEGICRIHAQNLSSLEYYKNGMALTQVLKDVTFDAYEGQRWCLTGDRVFDMRLAVEIAANARRYQGGKCVLNERGMMRKKRVILPHLYYIGSTSMLINNMNTLEYLMFLTNKQPIKAAARQKALFDWLLDMELGFLSLSNIGEMSPAERAIVTLAAAVQTPSNIIVLNLPRLQFSSQLIDAAVKIGTYLSQQGKTLLFATTDMALAHALCTHLVVLRQGSTLYSGQAAPFAYQYDRRVLQVHCDNPNQAKQALLSCSPSLHIKLEHTQVLNVYDPHEEFEDLTPLFQALSRLPSMPSSIQICTPFLGDALKEALEKQ